MENKPVSKWEEFIGVDRKSVESMPTSKWEELLGVLVDATRDRKIQWVYIEPQGARRYTWVTEDFTLVVRGCKPITLEIYVNDVIQRSVSSYATPNARPMLEQLHHAILGQYAGTIIDRVIEYVRKMP